MADRPLTVRVPEETAKQIESIVDLINEKFHRSVKTSDVLRSAIEEYVKRVQEEKENLFIKLPFNREMTVSEIQVILEGLKHIQTVLNSTELHDKIRKYEEKLEFAEFLEWKLKKGGK